MAVDKKRFKTKLTQEERLQELLSLAEAAIMDKGLVDIRLNQLVEQCSFSRGTFFSDLPNKETLFAQLAIKGMSYWIELIEKGKKFKGSPRERFLTFHVAHMITIKTHPILYECIYIANINITRRALDEVTIAKLDSKTSQVLDYIEGYVNEGLAAGDLEPLQDFTAKDFASFLWAGQYGINTMSMRHKLESYDLALKYKHFLRQTLDNIPWHPTSEEINYDEVVQCIIQEVYPHEYELAQNLSLSWVN